MTVDTDAERERSTVEQSRDGAIEVLHVDSRGARQTVSAYVAASAADIEVTGVADGSAALSELESAEYDCLAVEPAQIEDWGWFLSALREVTAAPLVLYTLMEPEAIDADVRASADTLVRKGQTEHRAFLVEKVKSEVQPPADGTTAATDLLADREDVGVFVLDGTGRIVYDSVSPAALFGPAWQAGGVDGGLHERLAAGLENGAAYRETVEAALEADGHVHGFRCAVPDGDGTRYLEYQSVPVGEDGPAGDRIETYRDVTDAHRALEAASEARELVSEAPDGLYLLDADGHYRFVNAGFADLLGYDRETLLGAHASMPLAEGELQKGQRAVQELLEEDLECTLLEMDLVTAEDERLTCEIHYTPLEAGDGSYAGLAGVVRDITDRKRRERELIQYRTLVEAAGDPMYVLDTDGNIELLNEAMAEFFGEPREEIVGRNVGELTTEESYEKGTRALTQLLRNDDQSWARYETREPDEEGTEEFYEVTVGLITDDDGEFIGSVGTFRDLTERRRRKEELDLLKQILTRVLRHNIRNQANVIEGHAEHLARNLDGRYGEMAAKVVEKCRDLVETSEKARVVERVMEGESVTIGQDLAAVVEESVSTVRDDYPGAPVDTAVPHGVTVEGIPKLHVAVQNLIENSVEHADTRVEVRAERAADVARVTIEDDGPGIPKAEIDVIRQNRETALQHSSGLGLWLANWVVQKSGGDISFETANGTRAVVELPLHDSDLG